MIKYVIDKIEKATYAYYEWSGLVYSWTNKEKRNLPKFTKKGDILIMKLQIKPNKGMIMKKLLLFLMSQLIQH